MNKKNIVILGVVLIMAIAVAGGFWAWKGMQKKVEIIQPDSNTQQNQVDVNMDNSYNDIEIPLGWKLYENKDFGIVMAYPEKNYTINENSGDIHFYYGDGVAPAGSQQSNYININISKEKNPQGVETLDELFEKIKNYPTPNTGNPWSSVVIKELIGGSEFIVVKSYNKDNFYAVRYVKIKGDENYKISFGGYWNTIGDSQYEMIIKIMESFRIIK